MNPLQYSLYSLSHKKEKSDLEKAFEDLLKKVELYEKQYEITLKLYKSEWDKEIKELNENHRIAREEIKRVYDEAFASMGGEDEYIRDSYAEHVSGLYNFDYEHDEEKDDIKKRYWDFFDLYSKSITTALYSLVESKLKEICDITSEVFDQKLKYMHLDSRDYLNTSFNYFEMVIQIPIISIQPLVSKLKDVQFIRNGITHTEATFSKDKKKTLEEIIKRSKGSLELKEKKSTTTLRIIKSKYIIDFFELIRELFEELIWLIDSHQEKKILNKGLEYWFGMLDKNISLKNIELRKTGAGKRNLEFDLSSRKKSIPKLKCKIFITRASNNSIDILNQTDSKAINEFKHLVEDNKSFLFNYVFKLFNQSKKGLGIEVMISPLEPKA